MFENERGFDVSDLGKCREARNRNPPQMIGILDDDVAEEIVRSRKVIHRPGLWHRFCVLPEALHLILSMSAQPHNDERLKAYTHDSGFDIGVEPPEDSLVSQPLDTL